MPVPGLDARLLATGISLGQRTLRHSTAQPMLRLTAGRQDVAVFTGRTGETTETVVEAAAEPVFTVLEGRPAASTGTARCMYRPGSAGWSGCWWTAGGAAAAAAPARRRRNLGRLWRHDTPSGQVLVYGPELLRTVGLSGTTARLGGDTVEEADLEAWLPRGVTEVVWNGRRVPTHTTRSGSLRATHRLPGAGPVRLPALTGWRRRVENPESAPDFDDSTWRTADRTTSFSTTPVPASGPVLFADDYGFHYGDVWYRGRFEDAAGAAEVSFSYVTGTQGLLMAWLDGKPLGTHRMPVPDKKTVRKGTWSATAAFPVAPGKGPHVLSVLVRRMQHDQDGRADDTHRRDAGSSRWPSTVRRRG